MVREGKVTAKASEATAAKNDGKWSIVVAREGEREREKGVNKNCDMLQYFDVKISRYIAL